MGSSTASLTARDTKVLAARAWATNAELIADVARLGYLRTSDLVLDPTHANGVWWKKWRPDRLEVPASGADFRHLAYPDASFDAIAFDPPYVTVGGRETSGIKDFLARYGLLDVPKTPEETQQLINDGLREMWRLVRPSAIQDLDETRPNGVVLVKCADYVWSGHLWTGVYYTIEHARSVGFVVADIFEHIGHVRAQPTRTRKCKRCKGTGIVAAAGSGPACPPCAGEGRVASRQHHARRNLSTLLVLRRPKP